MLALEDTQERHLATLDGPPPTTIIVALAAVGAAILAFTQRKSIAKAGKMVLDEARRLAFKAILPSYGRQYADLILKVAAEQNISPFIIAAILDRESRFGDALTPKGPSGTGDGGHGRGLMQIDDRFHQTFIATGGANDPYKAMTYGIKTVLKGKMAYLASNPKTPTVTLTEADATRRGVKAGVYRDPRPLSGDALVQASIAAYNAGELAVLKSLAAGKSADATTAHGNYSNAVLTAAKKFSSLVEQKIA